MTTILAHTPLCDWHANHGGRMVDFAGWLMPVQYSSIVTEHVATRTAVGLFDVSHMGRFRFVGANVDTFLDRVVTRKVATMKMGQVRYSLVTNDAGGILDDILIYYIGPHAAGSEYLMVVNASNRQKIWDWLQAQCGSHQVELTDITLETAMIAVQGPRAIELARPLVEVDVARMRYYHAAASDIAKVTGIVSRTGYTGEDGCELIVPATAALAVWERLYAAATGLAGTAAGLGARDTLRLEAAMPLYGHELDERTNPFQAGLDFAVDLDGRTFPGRNALVRAKNDPQQPRRVGLELDGKRVPREGYAIYSGDKQIGSVTSGTFSPTFDRPLAMGYVHPAHCEIGSEVQIDLRGTRLPARVVKMPFYKRQE